MNLLRNIVLCEIEIVTKLKTVLFFLAPEALPFWIRHQHYNVFTLCVCTVSLHVCICCWNKSAAARKSQQSLPAL